MIRLRKKTQCASIRSSDIHPYSAIHISVAYNSDVSNGDISNSMTPVAEIDD